MEKAKLYVLQDPDTLEIRYVGITMKNLSERLNKHLIDVKNKSYKSPKKVQWIESIILRNKLPIISLVKEYDNISECKNAEIEYIKTYSQKYNLTNNSIGGRIPWYCCNRSI